MPMLHIAAVALQLRVPSTGAFFPKDLLLPTFRAGMAAELQLQKDLT